MQEQVVEETQPTAENQFNAAFDDINLQTCTSISGTATIHERSGMSEMSKQEIVQQVIHEDFKRIVDEMHMFRVSTYSQAQSSKQLAGSKYACSKRWVCFFHGMINLGIFFLNDDNNLTGHTKPRIKFSQLSLSRLILATQLN